MAQLVKNLPAVQETLLRFLGWEDMLDRDRLTTPVFLGFPCGSVGIQYSSILAREFHGRYSPCSCEEWGTTEQLSLSVSLSMRNWSVRA